MRVSLYFLFQIASIAAVILALAKRKPGLASGIFLGPFSPKTQKSGLTTVTASPWAESRAQWRGSSWTSWLAGQPPQVALQACPTGGATGGCVPSPLGAPGASLVGSFWEYSTNSWECKVGPHALPGCLVKGASSLGPGARPAECGAGSW